MELKDEDPPPFWLQSSTALHHRRRRHQGASSLFLNTGVLVVVLLAAAVLFLAIVIPSVLSLARQVFNPSVVKSSWNSLNLVLVIFAIVCGFLGRKDENDQTPVSSPMRRETGRSVESSPRQWNGYQDSRMMYNNSFGNVDGMRRLRRNGSSYPDLRQEETWMVSENRWRFNDDTYVYRNQQFERSDSRLSRSRSMGVIDQDEIEAKNIEVDTSASDAKEARPTTPSSPPPAARKHDRSDQCQTKNIEVDTSENDQPEVLKSEMNAPASVRKPAPPSPPAYSQQPMSPPSPISPTRYFWPSPSPPPPPPPPPPRASSSALAKNKRDNDQTKRKSRSKVETEMPPSPPSILSQPWTPPSPLSPINYFWPPPSPPPPPPPPPPPLRTHPTNLLRNKHENKRNTPPKRESRSKIQVQPPPPPPPPPPATPPRSRTKLGKSSEDTRDKKGGIVIRTLGRLPRRKRKSTRRSYENLEEFIEPPKVSIHRSKSTPEFPPTSPPRAPPPPRSPPPQHSIFQNIFSKKGKNIKKKTHSASTSGPPHPPPPPAKPLHRTKVTPPSSRKPVPPARIDNFSSIDENIIGNGNESPLIPIPPPPPPPPYKMPSWKFVMQGDFGKTESYSNSPRSGYSASEDEDSSSSNQKTSNASPPPLFCQSPDVNTKADDFIARFRAKLNLEKMNSIKLNQGNRLSPLGPDSARFDQCQGSPQ